LLKSKSLKSSTKHKHAFKIFDFNSDALDHGKENKRMHPCASFKIEDFNKDCHSLGDHACASPLILCEAQAWSPKGKQSSASLLKSSI